MDGNGKDDNELGYHDQDSEPTLNAPEEQRPDGITAPQEDGDSEQE